MNNQISSNTYYIGVNDHITDLFEGQYKIPNGIAYNSYVILDEKICILDTVDAQFADEWLLNLSSILNGKTPDYLIIQHIEPDHSGSIKPFLEKYPNTRIIANAKTFVFLKQFFDIDLEKNKYIVSDNETLSLGTHTLSFTFAPMVHWPEVMVTYDHYSKTLFSADAFGKFGALDVDEDWACEARRYYFGIVGKYGVQVQTLLKKLSGLEIQVICPLHGPVLHPNLSYYISLYNTWSSYQPENKGIVIAYTSVYGNTKNAAMLLKEKLLEKGAPKVVLIDLARCDMAEAVEDAFRYDTLVLATTTHNSGIFPFMHEFITELVEHNYQNRTIALIENGTWAPTAAKVMRKLLETRKNIKFAQNTVSIKSALDNETITQIDKLANELVL